MKIKPITTIAAIAFLPIAGFAQTPSAPPVPPSQPGMPAPPSAPGIPARPGRPERAPKVPVTFLGVETSQVPSVVSEQLGLTKGFGLVVDYVVPSESSRHGWHSTERYPQDVERSDSDRAQPITKAPPDLL